MVGRRPTFGFRLPAFDEIFGLIESLENAAASDSSIDSCAEAKVVLIPSGPHAAIFEAMAKAASRACPGSGAIS